MIELYLNEKIDEIDVSLFYSDFIAYIDFVCWLDDVLSKGNKEEMLFISQFLEQAGDFFNHTRKMIEKRKKRKGRCWAYEIPALLDREARKIRQDYFPFSCGEGNNRYPTSFVELILDPTSVIIDARTKTIDYNKGTLIEKGDRLPGEGSCGVLVGIKSDPLTTTNFISRFLIIGDLTHANKGAILAEECATINAAIRYAAEKNIDVDWFSASFGVEISQERGIESLDASASTAREIIKYASHGPLRINLIVDLPNIGAQAYWDALAAILPETRGLLIMTKQGAIALTGHKALAAALSCNTHSLDLDLLAEKIYPEGLQSLGGYQNIYGPNGEAIALADDLPMALTLLMRHHYFSHANKKSVVIERKKKESQQQQEWREEILIQEITLIQKGRKANRMALLHALVDEDALSSSYWWKDAKGQKLDVEDLKKGASIQGPETLVAELLIGGIATLVIFPPSGPLAPLDALIISKAIYKASALLPVLILANLTGFNSDPLSMKNWQLEAGAHIAKAIVQHEGTIVIVNLGSLVGGTFVIFSKQLHPQLKIVALAGSNVKVIGGSVAAKVVFHHKLLKQAMANLKAEQTSAILNQLRVNNHSIDELQDQRLRQILQELEREVSLNYDAHHSIERALQVGSIDAVTSAYKLRSTIIAFLKGSL